MRLKKTLCVLFVFGLNEFSAAENNEVIESFAYYEGKFQSSVICQNLAIQFPPYYLLNTALSSSNNQLRQGSFVDYHKQKIIRSWELLSELPLNTTLTDNLLDTPEMWKIKITAVQNDQAPLPLENKILEIQKNQNRYLVQRCCTGTHCQILPFYKVYDNQKWIANLAFSPKKSDFIKSYSLIKGLSTLKAPAPLTTAAVPSQKSTNTDPPQTSSSPQSAEPTSSFQQNVVCTKNEPLRVYDDSLKNVVYRIQRFQAVKVFQDWNGRRQEKMSENVLLIKVQVTNAKGENIDGWAAASYIQKPSDCEGFTLIGSPTGETLIENSTIVVDNSSGTYRFPTQQQPFYSYTKGSGQRYFGAVRSDRKHAACDLLRPPGEKIFAVANGVVLNRYFYYRGTYAMEVKHDSGPVVLYGEVSPNTVAQSAKGQRVVKGQHIGYIGDLKMLHFEMYKGTASGPLTQRGRGAYSRRSDLMDPTTHLLAWEKRTFNTGAKQ